MGEIYIYAIKKKKLRESFYEGKREIEMVAKAVEIRRLGKNPENWRKRSRKE